MLQDRTPQTPPIILPVANISERPLWSIMIPTYNCLNYLKQTLKNVLSQDLGPALMQIEVIDDCSTDGDVETLVKEIGKERVEFFSQSKNVGSLRNFETCLNRSRGEYIHLLHGDDIVLNGFYTEIGKLFSKFPNAGAAFTMFSYIDENGDEIRKELEQVLDKPGIIENWLYKIAERQRIQPPAIVVKRSVYEHLGGFYGVHYGEDWEMWIRIAAHYPVAYSPKCLARYRGHQIKGANITSRSILTGQNIKDISRVISLAQNYLPTNKRSELKNIAKKNFSIHYAKVANKLYLQSKEAAFAQGWAALKMHCNIRTIFFLLKLYFMHFVSFVPVKITDE